MWWKVPQYALSWNCKRGKIRLTNKGLNILFSLKSVWTRRKFALSSHLRNQLKTIFKLKEKKSITAFSKQWMFFNHLDMLSYSLWIYCFIKSWYKFFWHGLYSMVRTKPINSFLQLKSRTAYSIKEMLNLFVNSRFY